MVFILKQPELTKPMDILHILLTNISLSRSYLYPLLPKHVSFYLHNKVRMCYSVTTGFLVLPTVKWEKSLIYI